MSVEARPPRWRTAVIRPGHNDDERPPACSERVDSFVLVLVPFASGDSRDLRGSDEAWLLGLSCIRRHPAGGRKWVGGVLGGSTG